MPRDPMAKAVGVLTGPITLVDRTGRVLRVGREAIQVPETISLDGLQEGQTVTVTYERRGDVARAVSIRQSG